MTKKEICKNSISIAYSSDFNGLEIKAIIYDEINQICAISNVYTNNQKYHKLRIYKNRKGEYVRLYGRIYYLDDFTKI